MKPAEDYILKQPEPYRSILLHLQLVIEQTLPEVELKYKWRLPCYYIGKRPICYMNKSKDYVGIFGNQNPIWNGKKINKRYIWSHFVETEEENMFSKMEDRYFFHNAVSFFRKEN